MQWQRAVTNCRRTSCSIALLACLCVVLQGQVTRPDWYEDQYVPGDDTTHPAYAGLHMDYISGRGANASLFSSSNFVLFSHPHHGEIYVEKTVGAFGPRIPIGTINTGLDYIFEIKEIRTTNGAVSGYLVIGHKNGKSRILKGTFPIPTNLSTCSLQTLATDSLTTELYLVADLIGSDLYFVDARNDRIGRFFDSNGDGLPDTKDVITSLPLTGLDRRIPGFFYSQSHEIGVLPRSRSHYRVLVSNGVDLVFESRDVANYTPKPFIGCKVREGIRILPVYYRHNAEVIAIAVSANGEERRISDKHRIAGTHGFAKIPLTGRVKITDKVKIVDVSNSPGVHSTLYDVVPGKAPVIIPPRWPRVKEGSTFVLDGANLKINPGANTVVVRQGSTVTAPSSVTFISDCLLSFDTSALTPLAEGGSNDIRISISHPAHPDGISEIKLTLIPQ